MPFLSVMVGKRSYIMRNCLHNKRLFIVIHSVLFNDNHALCIMKTINIGKHKVTFYDAISELPISRFHVYNKMLLVDSGVGSDITDFDAHLERIVAFMHKKDNENAIKEIQNLRQNYYLIQQSLSPKHMAFAALIKEIDGKPRENLTDEALQEIVNMFAEEQKENIDKPLKEAKKKSKRNFKHIFRRFMAILPKKNIMI